MSDGYDGVEVMDRGGAGVGKVERTYVDDSGSPRYIEVKFGTLLPRHRLVPAAEADLTEPGVLQVAYDKATIERSPDAPDSDTLEPADLERIDTYYEGFGNSAASAPEETAPAVRTVEAETSDQQPDASQRRFEVADESAGGLHVGDQVPAGMEAPIKDRGDSVEVPVLEEVLVKKTVVREILRVKKSDLFEQETIGGDVRKESLEVNDPSGAASDTVTGSASS